MVSAQQARKAARLAWEAANPELALEKRRSAAREARRRYRAKHQEKVLKADREARKRWRAEHPDLDRQKKKAWTRNRAPSRMVTRARKRAATLGLECTIRPTDLIVPEFCPLLGIPLRVGDGRLHDNSPSLDRINPGRGYVPGNVWVISYRANRIKNDATADELLRIGRALQEKMSGIAADLVLAP